MNAALAVLLAGAIGGTVYMETRPPGPRERLEALRVELGSARASADSCRVAVEAREARFHRYGARVDSLRDRITEYEALDPDGVPGDRYAEYLETFDRYNETVPEWGERADSLQTEWEACRALTEIHNALADSARGMLQELTR